MAASGARQATVIENRQRNIFMVIHPHWVIDAHHFAHDESFAVLGADHRAPPAIFSFNDLEKFRTGDGSFFRAIFFHIGAVELRFMSANSAHLLRKRGADVDDETGGCFITLEEINHPKWSPRLSQSLTLSFSRQVLQPGN